MSEHDREVAMRDEYDFSEARRGPILPPMAGKTRITIRLDNDILEWFRAQVHQEGGGNYQTLINHTLRNAMSHAQLVAQSNAGSHIAQWFAALTEPVPAQVPPQLIALVRQIVREELERAK